MNAFTDKEWGEGTESPSIFNPTQLDTRQWAKVCKDAGMKMIILTAKHHDGFCLWPSKYTEHSVKNSPYKDGKGDIVGELARACREAGLKLGLYLSPWDRHEPTYGDTEAYNRYYKNQLRELLTNYGEITEVWFDGAKGPNAKNMEYDWNGYYALVHELQPKAVIFNGPDIRWVGNERGYARESEWSVMNRNEKPFDFIKATAKDLGSLEALGTGNHLIWYPAETDVSIRPGWFYHAKEDDKVKSVERLLDIYFSSVGYNSVLLLNLPPDRRGLIHENDVQRLREFRQALERDLRREPGRGRQSEGLERAGQQPCLRGRQDHRRRQGNLLDDRRLDDRGGRRVRSGRGPHVQRGGIGRAHPNGTADQQPSCWNRGTAATGRNSPAARRLATSGCCASPTSRRPRVRLRILDSRVCPTLSGFGLYHAPTMAKVRNVSA